MALFAIDPGPAQSAWVSLAPDRHIFSYGSARNAEVRLHLAAYLERAPDGVAIEMIASYGRPVGAEVFETCLWIGRFIEMAAGYGVQAALPLRKEIGSALCSNAQGVNDAVIRQRLIDIYGPGRTKAIGTKKHPGPLYGVTGDVWQALAVGLYILSRTTPEVLL